MVRADYFDNPDHLPDYYDTMYLDGLRYLAQREQQPEDYNIKFNSEIKVKK